MYIIFLRIYFDFFIFVNLFKLIIIWLLNEYILVKEYNIEGNIYGWRDCLDGNDNCCFFNGFKFGF